ncbi:MAG: HIT domain-containing protein [Deltaproteobacteria bacterium]|nr:HIT domain-containing protein [Deltaproteobacteria bacterium]
MDVIISPGRMEYLKSSKPDGCIFCENSIRDARLVLFEGRSCYVMMNKYPYTTGHLLVIPYRHICEISDMTAEEKQEMMNLTDRCIGILKQAMNPEGFNIGINLGKAAGAGVDCHLHLHIVPRWIGDTNFTTVLGEVRVIPEDIETTRSVLLPCFQNYEEV